LTGTIILKNFDLTGKIALITGATGLLGMEHCEALADIGCEVVLTDLDPILLSKKRKILEQKYPAIKFHSLEMDVSSEISVQNTQSQLELQDIKLDILINNAAVNPQVTEQGILNTNRLENFGLDDWNRQISVGLTGAFLCSKYFGFMLAKNETGGVIVNIASDLSVIAPDQRLYKDDNVNYHQQDVKPVTYSVVKTGLIGLTRYLSTYWADSGVRCNALSPGGVKVGQPTEFVERVKKLIPAGRMAASDEYRSAIQFLCSDASKYMTGQNLIIDGGRSVW
jgi:NAD(P)-dependent dehydrogenase (short-subunit alcohol dehydrogenase family)